MTTLAENRSQAAAAHAMGTLSLQTLKTESALAVASVQSPVKHDR